MRASIKGYLRVAVILAAASLSSACGLYWNDYPQQKLEAMRTAEPQEKPPAMTLEGARSVVTRSSKTRLVRRLLPGSFFVHAKLNGKKAQLLLDSGADITLLEPRLASRAGVRLVGPPAELQHGESSDVLQAHLAHLDELAIEHLRVLNLAPVVTSKRPQFGTKHAPIATLDGLLGQDVLQHLALRMDFERLEVFLSRDALLDPTTGVAISDASTVTATIGTLPPMQMLLDTGASGPSLIPAKVWDQLELGTREIAYADLRIGDMLFEQMPVVRASDREVPLISNSVFVWSDKKHVTLDFINNRMHVE